jgi:glycosyltransferase 2 family protein
MKIIDLIRNYIMREDYEIKRFPENVFSILFALTILIFYFNIIILTPIAFFQEYISEKLDLLPDQITTIGSIVTSNTILILLILCSTVYAFINGRRQLSVKILLSSVFAYLFANYLGELLQVFQPNLEFFTISNESFLRTFPSSFAATITSLFIISKPHIKNNWRRVTFYSTIFLIILRGIALLNSPLSLIGGIISGWFVGSAMHLIFGIETKQKSPSQILQILQKLGYKAEWLEKINADARGSLPYIVNNSDGSRLFVKVVSKEHRDADSLFKLWRKILFRNIKNEIPYLSVVQKIEHEGFLSTLASKAGVSTPDILGTACDPEGNGYLFYEYIEGKGFDSLKQDEINEKLLLKLWDQVRMLHKARIAHRDMRLANIFVRKNGDPMLMDFGFSESYASTELLGRDLAEIFVSLALIISPQQVADTALLSLDKNIIMASLKFLQPMALSTATRDGLSEKPEVLKELCDIFEEKLQRKDVEKVQLTRFDKQQFFTTISFLVLIIPLLLYPNIIKNAVFSHKFLSILSIFLFAAIYFIWQIYSSKVTKYGVEMDLSKLLRRFGKNKN